MGGNAVHRAALQRASVGAGRDRRRTATLIRIGAGSLVILGSLLAGLTSHARPHESSGAVTWSADIAPIVQRHCIRCHTAGGFAPFSLATYEEAQQQAEAIKEAVRAGEMPPWGATSDATAFANDRRLTPHEIDLLTSWVDDGAPEGAGAFVEASFAPDGLIVPLANEVVTEESERDARVTLQLQPGYTLTRWTFEPGSPAIVERADLELGNRWLGAWTPGEVAIDFPEHAGVPLPESSLFTVNIDYSQPAERTVDYSRLRLWITRTPDLKTVRATTVIKSWRSTSRSELFAVRPEDDDKEVRVVARFANGRVVPIGTFEPPGASTHPTYRLAAPLELPVGARVEATAPVRMLYVESAGPQRSKGKGQK